MHKYDSMTFSTFIIDANVSEEPKMKKTNSPNKISSKILKQKEDENDVEEMLEWTFPSK